jgi:hypothetical protein
VLDRPSSDKDMALGGKTVADKTALAAMTQADVVMLISGKLDDNLVAMLTQAQTGNLQNSVAKLATPTMTFRRVDAETLLVGAESLLGTAAQRLSKPLEAQDSSSKSTVLASRALLQKAALQGDHDVWIAGRVPDVPMTAGVGANIKNFALGLSLPAETAAQQSGILEFALEAASAPLAESLLSMLRDAAAQQPQWAGLLETSVDDATIHLVAKLPQDRTREAIAAAMNLAPKSPSTTPPAPEPPARKTVRIHGLSEGELEIPLH